MAYKKKRNFFTIRFLKLKWYYLAIFLYSWITYSDPEGYSQGLLQSLYSATKATLISGAVIYGLSLIIYRELALYHLLELFNVKHTAKDYQLALRQTQQELDPDEDFIKLLTLRPRWFYLHLPKVNRLWYQIAELRLALARFANINVKPLALKHRLPLPGLRFWDVLFFYHYISKHKQDNAQANLLEKMRYSRLYHTQLGQEIDSYGRLTDKKHKTKKEKQFLKLYRSTYLAPYAALVEDGDSEDWLH